MENLSPVVERRSRRIGPVDHTAEEVAPEELNDDEEERSRYRQQLENDTRNQSANEKRLSASDRTLSEHFQSCIQLAAENKINAKNAFNFKLIDLLHVMLNKKKQIPDFTEVTSSLDAGIKIYSYRVDNVHSDTMKMATTICSATNKNKNEVENDAQENSTNEGSPKKKKHLKKSNKSTLVTNPDQINRNNAEERFGISPPFLSAENFITSSAIFDNNRMCLHLNLSSNFWNSDFEAKANISTNRVPIELPDIQDDIICPTFKDFSFKGKSDTNDITLKEKIVHEFDYEPTINDTAAVDDDLFDDRTVAPDIEEVNHGESNGNLDTTFQTACLSKVMSSSNFASDISHLIASETSEYCYFNTQLLKKKWSLKSMGHWNPFVKKNREILSRPRTQKKELIDFENFDDFKAFEDDAKIPLTILTSCNRDKFIITPITHFNFKEFFRLKTCRDMFVVPTSSHEEEPSDLEETINDYNYNNPNDSQHLIPEQYEDDYADNFDDRAAGDVHEAINTSVFQGDNLVEIPNKVAKIQLPYMVKDKSVDMKHLKSKIWQKIDHTEELKTQGELDKELRFSDICQDIISDAKTELSVPILFNAILQLANDKNLEFASSEQNLSNFFVRVANGIEGN